MKTAKFVGNCLKGVAIVALAPISLASSAIAVAAMVTSYVTSEAAKLIGDSISVDSEKTES